MNIKYFDNFEGLWRDVTGTNGQVLQYGASGWTNASISGGTSAPASWGSISGNIADQKDLTDYVQSYAVAKNAAISGATKTKITYDSKGLVTAGTDITAADISGFINANKISSGLITNAEYDFLDGVSGSIQTQLNSKQDGSGLIAATRIASGIITNAEYEYLDGVSGNIQTQINTKLSIPTWVDYSGSTSIVGFSSVTTGVVNYMLIGKIMYVQFNIIGTSNATNFTFTLPFSTPSNVGVQSGMHHCVNNTTTQNYCTSYITASSNVVNLYLTNNITNNASWGATGTKRAEGFLIVNIA